MLPRKLKQLLKLSGGKVIINDEKSNKAFVVMGLKEYLREIRRMGELDPEEFWERYDFDEWELEDEYYFSGEEDSLEAPLAWEEKDSAGECFLPGEKEGENYLETIASLPSFGDPEERLDKLPKRNFKQEEAGELKEKRDLAANLTNAQLLDRINADIAQLRQRKVEEELESSLEAEQSEQSEIRYEEV